MKKLQPNSVFKTAGNAFADSKITRIKPNMQMCGTQVMDDMGSVDNVSIFDGMTPAEAADAIEKINMQGKRSTDLPYWAIVIETVGQRRLAALLSEFMGY